LLSSTVIELRVVECAFNVPFPIRRRTRPVRTPRPGLRGFCFYFVHAVYFCYKKTPSKRADERVSRGFRRLRERGRKCAAAHTRPILRPPKLIRGFFFAPFFFPLADGAPLSAFFVGDFRKRELWTFFYFFRVVFARHKNWNFPFEGPEIEYEHVAHEIKKNDSRKLESTIYV